MIATRRHASRLTPLVAAIVAVVAGVIVAAGVATVPSWRLEAAVMTSGLPALLPAAAPPLGWTARIALMLAGGGAVAALLWSALLLLAGDGLKRLTLRKRDDEPDALVAAVPSVRRADAHPDAPPRAPVMAARDLGKPFLDVTAPEEEPERPLPRDLDLPMAAFDPMALPAVPVAPPPSVKPLFRQPESARASHTPFEETGIGSEPAASRTVAEPTVPALLARLEQALILHRQSVAGRTAPPAPRPIRRTPDSLESTLLQLRKLATKN